PNRRRRALRSRRGAGAARNGARRRRPRCPRRPRRRSRRRRRARAGSRTARWWTCCSTSSPGRRPTYPCPRRRRRRAPRATGELTAPPEPRSREAKRRARPRRMGTRLRSRGRGARRRSKERGAAWSWMISGRRGERRCGRDRARRRGRRGGRVFDDDLEDAVVERLPRRLLDANDPFALADPRHLDRAVMAVGVIAGFTEGDEAGPRAAALAVAPEVAGRAVARVAERFAPLPDVFERRVADVAARPWRGRQRGAALDRAVGLDAERGAARAARPAAPAVTAVVVAAKHGLVGAEVADVVARPQAHAELVAPLLQGREQREEL